MREWDPDQYLQFKKERTQPSIDLVARIPMDDPKTIIDIGCGPGNSTQILLKRWPHADILGLDKSEKMIQKAGQDYPRQKWIVGDASTVDTRPTYDIVFSNAAIHWIPRHDVLLQRLFKKVNQNGILAIQVPANQESPLYQAILRVSRSNKWRAFTSGREASITYHSADFYYGQLSLYTKEIIIWETVYYHIMNYYKELIDWYKGTAMKPYLDSLPTDESRDDFGKEVLNECKAVYPLQRDGRILYPFKRLFFIARRPFDA
ncbi:MAG: methyltransferase domain-containing protein [Nitrospirota bacterium]